ncbi:MAG: PHP domain-containing protein [bacterium]|nr:PHP domain-containing protein [bacterium]
MRKSDLHLHSNFSDGSETPEELLNSVKTAHIATFALTDHDTIEGCEKMKMLTPPEITFIRGVELTCETENFGCHILGYLYDEGDEGLSALIAKGKKLRRVKLERRIEYLRDKWGINLTKEELDWLYSRPSVVKTHFANILVNRKLATDTVSAMKKYLDTCVVPKTKFSTEEGISTLLRANATPIWAHPLGGEGEVHIEKEVFLKRLETMKSLGIKGLECCYSRYSKEEIDFLLEQAKINDLLISGGSDYHGKNKTVKIGNLSVDGLEVSEENLTLISYLLKK